MPGPVAPMIASAAIGAGASIFGASKEAQAAKAASKAQTQATRESIAAQEKALERQIGLQEPFRQLGVNALAQYPAAAAYTPFGMDQFQADPGYQFRMAEGMKALERSAAARGILSSGQTLKDITRFGQDTASQEYQNAFNRYVAERQQKLAPLEYQIGLGQNAASNQGANIGNTATRTSDLTQALGNIRASNSIAQGNAFTNAMSNIGSIAKDTGENIGGYYAGEPYRNYLASIQGLPPTTLPSPTYGGYK